jgi:hypothetical protein
MTADPLQLPETAGELAPLLAPATRVWLAWAGVSTIVAIASAYLVGILIRTEIETGIACFGIAMAWSAMTPAVIRRLGRWLHG